MNLNTLLEDQKVNEFLDFILQASTLTQLGIVLLITVTAYLLVNRILQRTASSKSTSSGPVSAAIQTLLSRGSPLLFPLLTLTLLRVFLELWQLVLEHTWLIEIAHSIALIWLYYRFASTVISNRLAARMFLWIGMPIVFMHVIGLLDDLVMVLESMSIELGNLSISAYGIARTLIFGSLLFWLGFLSRSAGQNLIRKQQSLDFRARELFVKLFEICLFTLIFMLLLQLMGINLTALAVFGGALGVGLGFGLQAITSNLISGLIIIYDRSISEGDYIELEDGRTGFVTNLNMRSTTLETYDGKDIVVPNEKFITSSFVNWTHKDKKQRYRVDFSVAYDTDVRGTVELIKDAVAAHPQVLNGPDVPLEERPDCEIDSFGDSGINMFVEFWMEGVDDGKNRVGGDLLLIILETLQQNGITIPFPQREVRLLEK